MPAWPARRSAPSPPSSESLEAPPPRSSSPRPPSSVSFARPPRRTSLPPRPSMRSGPRVPVIWSGPSVPIFTARPGCVASARGCVPSPRRWTPSRRLESVEKIETVSSPPSPMYRRGPSVAYAGAPGPSPVRTRASRRRGREVDDRRRAAAAVRCDDRAVALGRDRERRADAGLEVDLRAPLARDAVEAAEDAVGRADPQQRAAVREGDAAGERLGLAALGLAERGLLRAADEPERREVDEADALAEDDRRLEPVGGDRDGAGLGALEVDGADERERRGVDDVDRAAASGEQARAVARQRQRADRAGEVERRGDGAGREVEDRDAAARGDVRARPVGGGGDRARRRAEVHAGGDLVGRHVGEDELARAGRDDDRAGVGGGRGGERRGGAGEERRERGAEHVCQTTRPGGRGCVAPVGLRRRSSCGQRSASWPQMTIASGCCSAYARIAASERR